MIITGDEGPDPARRRRTSRLGRLLFLGVASAVFGCGVESRRPSTSSPAGGGTPMIPSSPPNEDLPGMDVLSARDGAAGPEALGQPAAEDPDDPPSPFRFTDAAAASGIDFVHTSGMTSRKYSPTANGSGAAVLDYDGDGKLDLYFANSTFLPVGSKPTGPNRLYRNLGHGRFQDVTGPSGLGFAGYCYGILAGDIDNDGDQDVFLCNYGPNALFLNNGAGTFRDISRTAGIDRPNWTSSGAFLDYDRDGDLDLCLANYADWKLPDDDVFCGDKAKKIRIYCHPKWLRPTQPILYRNNGDHTFTDVTDTAGIGRGAGRGFGVVAADLNDDGLIDLYIANDNEPNFLFLNRGDGTFEDATMASGAGLSEQGQAYAGMGVDAEDVDGDGLPELFVSNFAGEYNTLYQNLGQGLFLDVTALKGLAADSIPWIGWGCGLIDLDNDGWPDCFVANGGIDENAHLLSSAIPYAQPPLLYRNQDGRQFRLVGPGAGAYFAGRHAGRGVAFGDLDDDGDIDLVISHKDGPPALLRNETPTANRWIRLELVGTRSNRDALGARVAIVAAGRTIHRQRKGGSSLMSSHDPRLLVGVGPATTVTRVTVRWPSGAVSVRNDLATNRNHQIIEPAPGADRGRGAGE